MLHCAVIYRSLGEPSRLLRPTELKLTGCQGTGRGVAIRFAQAARAETLAGKLMGSIFQLTL